MTRAKLFQNGGSQAVRIPKEFRFETEAVIIRKTEMGLLLIPDGENYWERWLKNLRRHQIDFDVEDIEDEPPQEREWDDLFT